MNLQNTTKISDLLGHLNNLAVCALDEGNVEYALRMLEKVVILRSELSNAARRDNTMTSGDEETPNNEATMTADDEEVAPMQEDEEDDEIMTNIAAVAKFSSSCSSPSPSSSWATSGSAPGENSTNTEKELILIGTSMKESNGKTTDVPITTTKNKNGGGDNSPSSTAGRFSNTTEDTDSLWPSEQGSEDKSSSSPPPSSSFDTTSFTTSKAEAIVLQKIKKIMKDMPRPLRAPHHVLTKQKDAEDRQAAYVYIHGIMLTATNKLAFWKNRAGFEDIGENEFLAVQCSIMLFNTALAFHKSSIHHGFTDTSKGIARLVKARRFYSMSLDLLTSTVFYGLYPRLFVGEDRRILIGLANNLGQIHFSLGDYELSRHFFHHSKYHLWEQTQEHHQQADLIPSALLFSTEDLAGLVYNTTIIFGTEEQAGRGEQENAVHVCITAAGA